MRWYKDPKTGRDALWLDESEIETTMEDQLRKAGLYPKPGNLVVDLERLLERHLKVELDRTAELDATVLGVTEFRPPKNPRVAINRELTGSALDDDFASRATVGRWRATVAHEASHVILHRVLFE